MTSSILTPSQYPNQKRFHKQLERWGQARVIINGAAGGGLPWDTRRGKPEVLECDETRSKLGEIPRRVALPEVIAPRNGDLVYLT